MSTKQFLRQPDVMRQTGLRESTLYRLIREGAFPKPYQLSERCVGWIEADVTAWIDARVEAPPPKERTFKTRTFVEPPPPRARANRRA